MRQLNRLRVQVGDLQSRLGKQRPALAEHNRRVLEIKDQEIKQLKEQLEQKDSIIERLKQQASDVGQSIKET